MVVGWKDVYCCARESTFLTAGRHSRMMVESTERSLAELESERDQKQSGASFVLYKGAHKLSTRYEVD